MLNKYLAPTVLSLLSISFFSLSSMAAQYSIDIVGDQELNARSTYVEVCLIDDQDFPHCVFWSSSKGIGRQPEPKKLNLADNIKIKTCRSSWLEPITLPQDQNVRSIIYPKEVARNLTYGNCKIDLPAKKLTVSSHYRLDVIRFENDPSLFADPHFYGLNVFVQVAQPGRCESSCQTYYGESIFFQAANPLESYEFYVMTQQNNTYVVQRDYFYHDKQMVTPPKLSFVGSKTIINK